MSQLTDELLAELKKGPRNSELAAVLQKMMDNSVKANADEAAEAAIARAGVITESNIHASAGLYDRFRESTYEQVWKVLVEAGLAHKPPTEPELGSS